MTSFLDYLRQCDRGSLVAGPIRQDHRAPPDTAKGLALASLSSQSDSWVRCIYTLVVTCNGCEDPLRSLSPDFHPPAGFAHARCTFKFSRRRPAIVCRKGGNNFWHLWWEFELQRGSQSRFLIRLIRPWLSETACATIP